MRVYQCDCCNKVISDPYTVKMKEFYLGVDTDYFSGIAIPVECNNPCSDCIGKRYDRCYTSRNF